MIKSIIVNSSRHLNNVCMDYFEHFCLSMYFSGQFLMGTIQAFIHAWIPCWFTSSTSALVNHIKIVVNNVGCEKLNKN